MTDPYRITEPPQRPTAAPAPGPRTGVLLWCLLAVGLTGNVVTSLTQQTLLGIPFGITVVVCAIALVRRHLGSRT